MGCVIHSHRFCFLSSGLTVLSASYSFSSLFLRPAHRPPPPCDIYAASLPHFIPTSIHCRLSAPEAVVRRRWKGRTGKGRQACGAALHRREACPYSRSSLFLDVANTVSKQWSQILPADSRDAETHRWWWADWREMIARWKENEKLNGFVEGVESLVVAGGQE
jgi:hypothetical protein